tara:strand:+ start:804 stop:1298 length:495 start_codon:yes stop_codon:yes gene_type:complete
MSQINGKYFIEKSKKTLVNIMDKIVIFIPLVTGYITSYFCRVGESSGSSLAARPPPVVFSIVWPILYILIGYSWFITRKKAPHLMTDILFGINTLISIKWIVLFGCLGWKKMALYDIVLLVASSLILVVYSMKYSTLAACLLVPYVAWLLFAQQLNYSIVNKKL